jgi:hypothetical protein
MQAIDEAPGLRSHVSAMGRNRHGSGFERKTLERWVAQRLADTRGNLRGAERATPLTS